MKNTGILCLLAIAALAVSGCKTNQSSAGRRAPEMVPYETVTNQLSPDLLQPPAEMATVGPSDQLDIEMQGIPTVTTTVGLDGKVYFSFLPGVSVAGLTLAQAQARLEQEMSKYISHPDITVSLKTMVSKHVWVAGRVKRPGTYPIIGNMRLLEAISEAGGTAVSASFVTTQDLADLRHSFVMRNGKALPVDFVRLIEEGDMSQNIYLKPDDFVFLPSSIYQQVYVLGAVTNPRAVPYTDHLTLVSALANVNGYLSQAYLTHVAILRGSLNQPRIIVVNYRAIVSGKATDVPLEPGDIVYIPLSPYRFITDYADLIVTTFVNAWSADMGIRVIQGSGNTGVAVPVSASGAATGGGAATGH